MNRAGLSLMLVLAAACGDNDDTCSSWRQWGNSASHEGASCVAGQPLGSAAADMVFDPFIAQEEVDAGGDLVVHYQAPLVDGDMVYMMAKSGTYTPCVVDPDGNPECFLSDPYRLNTEVWQEQAFEWQPDGTLAMKWSFDSDWKPEPNVGFEPMFQPALAGDMIAIPGAGGTIWELDRMTGATVRQVQPFQTIDPDTYVAGGIAVAPDGTIYYSTLKLDHDNPYGMQASGNLIAVATDGSVGGVDYQSMVTGAPGPNDACFYTYDPDLVSLPWPPKPLQLPPQYLCGAQRPGINSTPAIGPDGTIFVASRAHFDELYSYVAAVNPDLSTKWTASLRDRMHDGCGITIPSDGTPTQHLGDCAVGAPIGLDPSTGLAPAGMVDDDSSASPVALPDGGVLYGSLTYYNGERGHLMKFDANGTFSGAFDFGWDDTPAIISSGDDYKIITKDNHYGEDQWGVDLGPYYITQLDSSLNVDWKFLSTNTQSCQRAPDGTVACMSDHPHGFEWCINAPAVDRDGTVFVNSEDGTAYAIGPDGQLRDSLFLDKAEGAAYTPVVIDHTGRVFAINNGHLVVLGQ